MGSKIHITGLPSSAKCEQLGPFFASCGGRIIDSFIMNTKGYGFVTFDNPDAASRAIKLSGKEFRSVSKMYSKLSILTLSYVDLRVLSCFDD
jgi:hypothetical protein